MTDTGQVPGEGLPQDAGTVGRPGVSAPGAHTFHDPSGAVAEDDDLLLMPGAQGAWTEDRPAFAPDGYAAGPAYGMGEAAPQAGAPLTGDPRFSSNGQAPEAVQPTGAPGFVTGDTTGYEAVAPGFPGGYDADPNVAQDTGSVGAHETAGRDSGFVDLGGARTPAPVRRPLHTGPPAPAGPAAPSPVRSLADRGPAGTPANPVPVRRPGPPTTGPEYLDIPREDGAAPVGPQLGAIPGAPFDQPGPQLGEIPAQAPAPWPQAPHAQGAETVVPQARPVGATPAIPDVEAFRAAQEAAGFQVAPAPQGAALLGVPEPAHAGAPAGGVQGSALGADSLPQAYGEVPAQGQADPGQGFVPAGGPQLHLGPMQSSGGATPGSGVGVDAGAMSGGESHPHTAPIPMPAASSDQLSGGPEQLSGSSGQLTGGDGGAPVPAGLNPQDPGPIGEFVPVDGVVPSTPHLAPTPPHALRLPDESGRDAAVAMQDAAVAMQDAGVATQDGSVPTQHGAVPTSDGSVSAQDAPAPMQDGNVSTPDAPVSTPDGSVPTPDAPVSTPDGSVPTPDQSLAPAHDSVDALASAHDSVDAPAHEPLAPSEPEQPAVGAAAAPEAVLPQAPQPVEVEPAQEAAVSVPSPREAEPEPVTAEAAGAEEPQAAEAADLAAAQAQAPAPEAPAAEPESEPTPVAAALTEPVPAEIPVPDGGEESPELLQFPDELDTLENDDAPVRADGPAAPGYADAEREAVLRVMRERRDIRNGFRSDPIPHEVLLRVLEAAHTAPSVGHSQPWDFVVIRSADTRRTMHELAMRQREAYAKSLPKGRAKQFKELKIEAILETPVNIVVTADPTRGGRHTLGRHTQPQMAPYSSALAVENLWLAARAEGLGVGWVSFFDEREMVRTLGLPEHLEVVAYLCVGYVDEFPDEPELMQAGWSKRRPLSWVVHEETYGRRALPGEDPHDLLSETVANIRPLDAKALGEAWERQKRMTKPAGALGMLEIISAQLAGLSRMCPPPIPEPAAVAIFAGDHGVHAQGVTPWPQEVTGQMVANFLGGGAVCNAFANQVGAEVCVIDVGVASDLPATPGLLPRKVRAGTADMTTGPALTREEVKAAIEVGIETARDLVAAGNKALLTGEMGIANTTASAALISVFTGADPSEVTGRGTGINDETLARKTDVVRRALELHQPDPADPIGVLAAIGGLEHAAIVGLLLGGASLRTPVILDGVSAGAAALVARAIAPEVLAACIAGHRSAEPGHVAALNKLGLRPLVDLDLRLGEGTGALLALPVVQSAARAMHEVATFDSAGVTEK